MKSPTLTKTIAQKKATALLASKARHVLLYGGSRSGKTLLICYAILMRAYKHKSTHVIFRKHYKNVKASIGRQTMPKLLELLGLEQEVKLDKSDAGWVYRIPLEDGSGFSEVWLAGLDDKDRSDKVLGLEFSTVYFNECSELSYDAVTTALSRLAETSGLTQRAWYDENPPLKAHWTHKLFIEGLDPEDNVAVPPGNHVHMQLNPRDNLENLDPDYIEELRRMPARKRKRFYDGEFQDDIDGALWKSTDISAFRVTVDKVPPMVKIVVGVDPAVSDSKKSDDTGIVVAGRDERGHYYVLADRTCNTTVAEWGRRVVSAYNDYRADEVVGEQNNGGDLVKMNIHNVEQAVRYKKVYASRGKIKRADPVAGLYEEGLVHHVGEFPDLETEMVTYTGASDEGSPNRMDALVWALTRLSLTGKGLRVHSDVADFEQESLPKNIGEAQEALMSQEEHWEHL